ncbi:DUF4332 domain-containing protein [Prochlorococcus sp. MIT 1307]|uniref:DUF4332 domain-containing protein n=1 Tax=Prochlorococcus sp. MIT 1307 TaxID=3096219 RepID=UPI002A749524|nr:DUF4332 domain-containing protein [Prochlorococcus sp. MIT 1307]
MEKPLNDLPQHFHEEEKQLRALGIHNWLSLNSLKEEELLILAQKSRATTRNLKRLRGMARLICEINLSQSEAALLLHAGIASTKALASLTPQELIRKTGRLERQLNTGKEPFVDLPKAQKWIKIAKRANSELT